MFDKEVNSFDFMIFEGDLNCLGMILDFWVMLSFSGHAGIISQMRSDYQAHAFRILWKFRGVRFVRGVLWFAGGSSCVCLRVSGFG